jgi:predicted lipid-binding transport protein (Tim44 family)
MSNDRVAGIMKTSRWLAVLAAVILLAPMLAPLSADARVGGGGSTGSRGARTGQAPAPTQTAPTAAPIQRSATPSTQPSTATAQAAPAASGGFMSRHPFMSGLMGGMLGAGLFGLMFGNGFGGSAGLFGLVFQLLLIGGIGYLAFRFFRGRMAAGGASPYAYAAATPRLMEPPMTRSSVPLLGGGNAPAAGAIAITTEDYNAFEGLLGGIQTAYSAGDLATLRTLVTPEMLGYFSEQLSGNASRGLENKVEAVKLEQGDLSEAWSELGIDYATVALRFSLVDYTRRLGDGALVEGNPQVRTEAAEVWTFLRSRGGHWILSAIQQAA